MRTRTIRAILAVIATVLLAVCCGSESGDDGSEPVYRTVAPVFSLSAGTYVGPQKTWIVCATNGCEVWYTLDGSEPTTGSLKYSGGQLAIEKSLVLKAFGKAPGYNDSPVTTAAYTIQDSPTAYVATPSFNPPPGTYTSAQSITISSASPAGAKIHFTTDGTEPNDSSPVYASPVSMGVGTTTLKAYAAAAGYKDSAIQQGTYSIAGGNATATPTFTPSGGAVAHGSTVTIASATPGAVIYYTVDGTTIPAVPAIGMKYTDPIAVTSPFTLKAVAKAEGLDASSVATADFTLSNVLFADACIAWNAAIAARKVSCLHANPDTLAGLHGALDCTTFQADIDAGLTTYDQTRADACTADLQALPCGGLVSTTTAGPFEFPVLGTACEGVLVGTGVSTTGQGTGTECRRSTQCASGYCPTRTLPGQCPGVCEDRVAEGVECAYWPQCAAGLACASGTCRARGTTGSYCYMDERCAADLRCLDGSCKAPRATGEACGYDLQCVAGDRCFGGTCQPLVGLGGTCVAAATASLPTVCGEGYWCDAGTCAAYPTTGQSCTDSVACTGGYCDFAGNQPTCAAYHDVGDTCTSKYQCSSQLASYNGICVAYGDFYCATP